MNPDPDPNRIKGFDDPKLKKKIQMKFLNIFFESKFAIYLSLGVPRRLFIPALQ
jgi:hypothetical protein